MFWRRNGTYLLAAALLVEVVLVSRARWGGAAVVVPGDSLRKEIARLRQENKKIVEELRQASHSPAIEVDASASEMEGMRDLAAVGLLRSGAFGTTAWARKAKSSLGEELMDVASALQLSPEQTQKLLVAAEGVRREMLEATLNGTVARNMTREVVGSALFGPELDRAIESEPAEVQRLLKAKGLAAEALSKGGAVTQLELPESPAAKELWNGLEQAIAGIMGAEKYELYGALGARSVITDYFRDAGLEPQVISIVSNYDAGKKEMTYDVRRVRTEVGQDVRASRRAQGPGVVFMIGGVKEAGKPWVSYTEGRNTLSLAGLQEWLGPLAPALPNTLGKQ